MPTEDISTRELTVIMRPCDLDMAEFIGSSSMLEAEGVIPQNTKWPEGYLEIYWQDERFDYKHRRQRPDGAKGPRRQFVDCDWWSLRWELTNRPSHEERAIALKTKALKDEIYRQSAKGQIEHNKNWAHYFQAARDEKFQAFKALVPGMVKPKRGRKPKDAQEANASNN